MTNAQILAMERIYRAPLGEGATRMTVDKYILNLNELHSFDTRNSFVMWDETNHLAHCIRVNNDNYTQVEDPLSISSTGFDNIVMLEALCNMDNFEATLDALMPSLDENIKAKIMSWATGICSFNSNLAPKEARPYFKTDPKNTGGFYKPIARTDLAAGDVVYDQGGFDN